jgi:hypothetical protein
MKRLVVIGLVLMLAVPGFSQEESTVGSPYLQKGDIIVGGKLALGSVYGASVGFVGNMEYGFKEDFLNIAEIPATLGLGVSFGYASYEEDYGAFGIAGQWQYTNIILLGGVYYHADVLEVEKLDTSPFVNIGMNFGSVEWDGPDGNYSSPSHRGLVGGTGVGARYYVSPQLSVTGEVGVGMGVLRIGLDYKL